MKAFQVVLRWFDSLGWTPQPFQEKTWKAYLQGKSGIVNAPTGSGKTYSVLLPAIVEAYRKNPSGKGLQILWITPIRALAKEIKMSADRALQALDIPWECGIRTGDTSVTERTRQKNQSPQLLITTPESLHLLLATKGYPDFFRNLQVVVADEWHELVGTKRGVQVELALSRLKKLQVTLQTWGISATIGNLGEAMEVLLGDLYLQGVLIRSETKKNIEVITLLPDEIETFPWGGHLGIHLLPKVLPVIERSKSCLVFTNTRSQAEIWYQRILEAAPHLAGDIAMHHGSLSLEVRHWVEEQLYTGKLKAVVCTSSLDLGVDFRPVETIIQIGGPKGVSRFLQRAGRSGHAPGETSRIWFVPTHSLEIIEGAALRQSIRENQLESRVPYIRSFDVLVQYLVTLAVSEGFRPAEIREEIRSTFCYRSISDAEFDWALNFIVTGGNSLAGYDEYHKVVVTNGLFKVESRSIAMRHKLSIGTIVSDVMIQVKFISGKHLGSIEEWFISRLRPGDVFFFGGRTLEFIRIREMTAYVKKSSAKTGQVPSWQGGKLPLSAQLGEMLRIKLDDAAHGHIGSEEKELAVLAPLFNEQARRSVIPSVDQFLIEKIKTREGCHVFFYPFEGRFVHEGMAALIAYRLSLLRPVSFSIGMNDYGFELLSDQDIPVEEGLKTHLFSTDHLLTDIAASINASEMARRRFRDIARIAGLVFNGYPGRFKSDRHLQSSSQLFFEVFTENDPHNLLLKQAYEEVYDFQLEQTRLRKALQRISRQKVLVIYPEKPTPFSFPIMVERIREKFTTETLEDRIKKMQVQFR